MCPFFYCVVKGSTVYFSVGAFLSCAVKEVEPCTSLGRNCETDSAYTWRGNPAHSEHPCLIPRAATRIRIFCVVKLAGSESDSSSSSTIIKKKLWNQRHTYIHTYSHFSFSPDSQKVLSSEHNLFLQDIMSITGFIFLNIGKYEQNICCGSWIYSLQRAHTSRRLMSTQGWYLNHLVNSCETKKMFVFT